jgi:hypothetical protein
VLFDLKISSRYRCDIQKMGLVMTEIDKDMAGIDDGDKDRHLDRDKGRHEFNADRCHPHDQDGFLRPCFNDLTPEQQANFGNGAGPRWFPDWLTYIITKWISWFFQDASWRHHDFGYYMGHTEAHRKHYDRLFLTAMLHDARDQKHGNFKYTKMYSAIIVSYVFFAVVYTFGRFAFNYGDAYDMSVLDVDPNDGSGTYTKDKSTGIA